MKKVLGHTFNICAAGAGGAGIALTSAMLLWGFAMQTGSDSEPAYFAETAAGLVASAGLLAVGYTRVLTGGVAPKP